MTRERAHIIYNHQFWVAIDLAAAFELGLRPVVRDREERRTYAASQSTTAPSVSHWHSARHVEHRRCGPARAIVRPHEALFSKRRKRHLSARSRPTFSALPTPVLAMPPAAAPGRSRVERLGLRLHPRRLSIFTAVRPHRRGSRGTVHQRNPRTRCRTFHDGGVASGPVATKRVCAEICR